MREISPAENISADEFLNTVSIDIKEVVEKIRKEKLSGNRPLPSQTLIDKSILLSATKRLKLLDKIALLVDENLFGRAEMCIQFSMLLNRALIYMGLPSKIISGSAMYFNDGVEIFRWEHTWVRITDELIDGNVDILYENPLIPQTVNVSPYWGPVLMVPKDRRLRENWSKSIPEDNDVKNIWWPDLKIFIESELK
jgi:hypothetical protein